MTSRSCRLIAQPGCTPAGANVSPPPDTYTLYGFQALQTWKAKAAEVRVLFDCQAGSASCCGTAKSGGTERAAAAADRGAGALWGVLWWLGYARRCAEALS